MRRIFTVLKVVCEVIAGLGLFGVCAINDASDTWVQTLILSFVISISGLLLAILFDKLSTVKIVLPDWMIYVIAVIIELFDTPTEKSSNSRRRLS